jgi:hypothetical protein
MIIPLQDHAKYPRLVFAHDVDEQEMAPHGYRGDVIVELVDGNSFPVYFYVPDAIREELDARRQSGFGQFVAEPGLVVIPEMTLAAMKSSVMELIEVDYFAHLRPCEQLSRRPGLNKNDNSGFQRPPHLPEPHAKP